MSDKAEKTTTRRSASERLPGKESSDKTEKSTLTSFRLPIELSEKLNHFRQIKETTLQDVMRCALNEYLDKHLTNTQKTIELINSMENTTEYMFIPEKYYMLFNNLEKLELEQEKKEKKVKTVTLGDITLIMIKVSKSIYKKAELIALKNEVSGLKQNINILNNTVASLKRNLAAITKD
ncbi:MAG: hypothetical protein RBT59_13855 [Arcobacteraceae bacterium]|nr:hypothetical protein [Arcobacteraceae bacterium]